MKKTVLLIATFDTKGNEALYLKHCIESYGANVLTMDTGILGKSEIQTDISREEIAERGGVSLEDAVASGDKGKCIINMMRGAEAICKALIAEDRIQGVIGIGGAQGTDIACAGMRQLPTGLPKLMVSTVASGQTPFGPFVGTKDITMMHSVADIQGMNFLTKRILENAAGAIFGMVNNPNTHEWLPAPEGIPVAMSMLGTTTPGALRCKGLLEEKGYEVVCFHQNGTGGIAMEDMIRGGAFKAVMDLALHEIGDRYKGGLHGAIREDRLEAAVETGVPLIVAPGSVNYVVLGPLDSVPPEMKKRKLIVHNPNLTLVRLSPDELHEVGILVADKLNRARGPIQVFIPLKGFSFPDREGHPHWDPEGNQAFIQALKQQLHSDIPYTELDAHINDPEFIDPVTDAFFKMMEAHTKEESTP